MTQHIDRFGSLGTVMFRVLLIVGILSSSCVLAQKAASREKKIAEIAKLTKKIEKLEASIKVAEGKLETKKESLRKEHARAFMVSRHEEVGTVLAQIFAKEYAKKPEDRESPQAICERIKPEVQKSLGRTVLKAAEKSIAEQIGLQMDEDQDNAPSVSRSTRIVGQGISAVFDRDFELAWPKLKTFLSQAKTLAKDQKKFEGLARRKEELEESLRAKVKGNHPKSLVAVAGQDIELGVAVENIETVAKAADVSEEQFKYLVWSTPPHKKKIADFLIDRYEIRHIDYWYFCKQTDRKGPRYTQKNPTTKKEEWIDVWPGGQIPEGWAKRPVTYVTCDDAIDYCEWTGCRLPYECEWELAGRSGKNGFDNRFWAGGSQGYAKYKQNDARAHDAPWRLGIIPPKGLSLPLVIETGSVRDLRSEFGLYDMNGSVAEWTASPFLPHTSFKPGKYFGREFGSADFDDEMRSVRGGHCESPPMMASSVFRQGMQASSRAKLVGFRRARSAIPGLDRLGLLMRGGRLQAGLIDFKLVKSDAKRKSDFPTIDRREGRFAALEKFDWNEEFGTPGKAHAVVVANRLMNDVRDAKDFKRLTRGDDWQSSCVLLATFHTDVDIAEPKLAAGTWFIAFKSKYEEKTVVQVGKNKKTKKKKIADSMIYVPLRSDLNPVWVKSKAVSTFTLEKKRLPPTKLKIERAKGSDTQDTLRLSIVHEVGNDKKRGFTTSITMKVEKGLLDGYE